jgi:hypothetical protein
MHQPMQGAMRMTKDHFRKMYEQQWPTERIAQERDDVLSAKAAGLSISEIVRATGLPRRDVQHILFSESGEGQSDG